jgi:hypothetical protein
MPARAVLPLLALLALAVGAAALTPEQQQFIDTMGPYAQESQVGTLCRPWRASGARASCVCSRTSCRGHIAPARCRRCSRARRCAHTAVDALRSVVTTSPVPRSAARRRAAVVVLWGTMRVALAEPRYATHARAPAARHGCARLRDAGASDPRERLGQVVVVQGPQLELLRCGGRAARCVALPACLTTLAACRHQGPGHGRHC